MTDVIVGTHLKIRDCGHDEFWLRDKILENPSILGLGELQTVYSELPQPRGGRLDLLLKDAGDNSMYEVELQLGETDETHIIRTIEYWESERRRFPQRSHTAVLVAEEITGRFFNVVYLLSQAVPIIGITANIIEGNGSQILIFNTILDIYEEPEEDEPTPRTVYDERYWEENNNDILECVRWYKALLTRYYGDVESRYFSNYLSMGFGGKARVWITKQARANVITIRYDENDNFQSAKDYLDVERIQYTPAGRYIKCKFGNMRDITDKSNAHEHLVQLIAPQLLIEGEVH